MEVGSLRESYYPHCDILLLQINWNVGGGFYYMPLEAQERLFKRIGREEYIKLPKPGTNPRGVEISKNALSHLVEDEKIRVIGITWRRSKIDYNPYKRWVDYGKEE
ncbi:MAG: ThaI family type II restriction endonuclease [bacterium]